MRLCCLSQCADFLLSLGARLDAVDKHGRTALHFVAFNSAHRSLQWLLRHGADWRVRGLSTQHGPPISPTPGRPHRILTQLLSDNEGRTVLHYACDHAKTQCLQILLKRVPVSMLNEQDDQGMTPLLWAAHHGHVFHLRLLLDRGANAAAVDVQYRTALHFAATLESPETLRLLLRVYPAGITAGDADGRTPLHLACLHGSSTVASELLQHMFSLWPTHSSQWLSALKDASGRTPLHCAAVMGKTLLVRELVRLGHTPCCLDAEGCDPEYYAQRQGHAATTQALAHAASVAHCHALCLDAVAV